MKKNKYFLIGPYPPPLGGVSVYIYRSKKDWNQWVLRLK